MDSKSLILAPSSIPRQAPSGTESLHRWSRKKMENNDADGTRKNVPSENRDKLLKLEACSGEALKIDRGFGNVLTTLALRKLFRKPEFSVLDGLNEYDDDFTYFVPRGELITHEMQRVSGELGDRIANADMRAEGQATELHDDQLNDASTSGNNAKSPEDEEAGGRA